MYRDCDHLVDDLHVYTVRGNWNDAETKILVKPVYERSNISDPFCKIVDCKGILGENLAWINPQGFKHISCKGIDVANYTGNNALFDELKGSATITELLLDNISITKTSNYAGVIANKITSADVTLNKIIMTNLSLTGTSYTGGLVGHSSTAATISNVSVTGAISGG